MVKIMTKKDSTRLTLNKLSNEIEDIFATFHDGTIIEWKGNKERLTLTIECSYLGEVLQSGFENFYIILNDIELIELDPWMNPPSLEKTIKTEIHEVFAAPLEIAYVKTENGVVKISCGQHDRSFNICGGTLKIKAKNIELLNHNQEHMESQQLFEANDRYWNNKK